MLDDVRREARLREAERVSRRPLPCCVWVCRHMLRLAGSGQTSGAVSLLVWVIRVLWPSCPELLP
jgi:hypothetical protein